MDRDFNIIGGACFYYPLPQFLGNSGHRSWDPESLYDPTLIPSYIGAKVVEEANGTNFNIWWGQLTMMMKMVYSMS